MTETESTALLEKESAGAPAEPLAITPVPEPKAEPEPASLEKTLRRLEEQSALQTELAKKRLFWARLSGVFLGLTMLIVLVTVSTLTTQIESA